MRATTISNINLVALRHIKREKASLTRVSLKISICLSFFMSVERRFPADNTETLKKTTLMRPQISKPHGAGVGRYEDSVACKFSFCHAISGPKM